MEDNLRQELRKFIKDVVIKGPEKSNNLNIIYLVQGKNTRNKAFIRLIKRVIKFIKNEFEVSNEHSSNQYKTFLNSWCMSLVRFDSLFKNQLTQSDMDELIQYISINFDKIKVSKVLGHLAQEDSSEAKKQQGLIENFYDFTGLADLGEAVKENKILKKLTVFVLDFLEDQQDEIIQGLNTCFSEEELKENVVKPLLDSFYEAIQRSD